MGKHRIKTVDIPASKIAPALFNLARQAGAISDDGFVSIEYKHRAAPKQAERVFTEKGEAISIKENENGSGTESN